MDTIISVHNLVNRFGKQVVHDKLCLEVHRDEILGLVGGSGTGKSVLMRSMLGLQKPAGGTITVLGSTIEPRTARTQPNSSHWPPHPIVARRPTHNSSPHVSGEDRKGASTCSECHRGRSSDFPSDLSMCRQYVDGSAYLTPERCAVHASRFDGECGRCGQDGNLRPCGRCQQTERR